MRLLRSVLRIFGASFALAGLLLAGLELAVRQPLARSLPYPLAARADPEILRRHVRFLCSSASPRDSDHPEKLALAARYLARELAAAGARVSLQAFAARGRSYQNVVAALGPPIARGSHPLVVGAHYDSFGDFGPNPGADDNASGAAALPEIARLLRERKLARPVLLVAYANEEPPYFASPQMGSAVHARFLRAAGATPAAMICLEMIGYFTPRQPWPSALLSLLYPGDGQFIAVAGRWRDRALARRVKGALHGSGLGSAVSYSGPQVDGLDASDHRSYWAEGWPAVMVTDTSFLRNPNYHAPTDRPETLDYRRMARVVDGVASAVLRIAGGRAD